MERGERTTDAVFRALADPTRRLLLDRLREQDGQTLRDLCGRLQMARQSVTQHLGVLEAASLVTVVRRGRERLHHLNPVPIHDIGERWIAAFERPRLHALNTIAARAEEYAMTAPAPTYVYVTYIRASAEQVWHALTDADLTASFWGHANVSDWQPGSAWEHRRVDGSGVADTVGRVVAAEPPTLLVVTFDDPDPDRSPTASTVTFRVEPHEEIVRLTVTHENLPDEAARGLVAQGWPAVLANLKSLLETGAVLPQEPWLMPQVPT